MILWLFFAFFSGLVFVDYQFNDWEAESQEEHALATRRTDGISQV